MHASDIPLVFNTVASPTTLAGDRADRFEAARSISTMWANFARTGRPVGAVGQPAWPAYDLKTRSTMVLDVKCEVVPDRFGRSGRRGRRSDPPQAHQTAVIPGLVPGPRPPAIVRQGGVGASVPFCFIRRLNQGSRAQWRRMTVVV